MKLLIIIISLTLFPEAFRKGEGTLRLASPMFRLEVVNVNELGKYKKLAIEAVNLLNETINSDEFKYEILRHDFDWKDIASPRSDSITNQMVFDSLYTWTDVAPIKLLFKRRGLRITAYTSKTAGKTSIGNNVTTTYVHWLDLSDAAYQCTLLSYTSHIAHEYCHQRGFFDKNSSNQSSYRDVVPYAIGDIVCTILNRKYKTSCECAE